MPPDRSFALEDVKRLVSRWSGGFAWAIELATDGVSTPVYRLKRGAETRYLRLAEQPGECRIAEKRAHDLVRDRGVRVPEVVWFDPLAPEVNRSAMITTAIPGVPLDRAIDTDAASAIVSLAGRDLARINRIPVRGYGWVVAVDGDGGLIAEHPDRASWTKEYRATVDGIPAGLLLDRNRLADTIAEWVAMPERPGSHLAHGDLDVSHLVCQESTYSGLIDFGEIRGADRAYDLGHFLLHDGERLSASLLPALIDGYRAAAPDVAITRREIVVQAVAIGVRALSRALRDPGSPYTGFLVRRLAALLDELAISAAPTR